MLLFFKKGIYWSDSLYIKQGVYNCSLYQLWKIYIFCSYRELQVWYYEDRSKDGGSGDNILYRRKNTADLRYYKFAQFRIRNKMTDISWRYVFRLGTARPEHTIIENVIPWTQQHRRIKVTSQSPWTASSVWIQRMEGFNIICHARLLRCFICIPYDGGETLCGC
jgi:hypothetical protein